MPKISVCLPVFNGRRYLGEAIETVLGQTHQDFELLVADDCSTDDSLEIAREYAARDDRLIVWRNSNRLGLFPNYNATIERATGEIIKLFAQDDLLIPTCLERHAELLTNNPAVSLVTGSRTIIGDHGEVKGVVSQYDEDRLLSGDEVIEANITNYCNWIGEPSCVSFSANKRGTGFDTALFHYGDVEYWFRIMDGGMLYYSSEPFCSFRRHEGSATRRNMRSMNFIADLAYIGDKYESYLLSKSISRQMYWEKMIDTISYWVYSMVDDESLIEPDSTDLVDPDNYDPATMARILKAIRYASMLALHKLTVENLRNESLVKDMESELFNTEEKLSNILNSPVTRASSAVRNVLTRLGSKNT
ncbi:MAG: glycosyltransferase [Candidatus Obscuribacterales bacterium]|nr:glycosyltransferase [Candidatus Obscuribacterales bacterium]